jgi:hypothetical protein
VRKSLEVDAESEQRFEVIVLSVGTSYSMDDLSNRIDGVAISDARREEVLENNVAFSSSTEFTEDAIPSAFVAIHADGAQQICISEPIAQAIVSTGQGFEVATHEYTHTQGNLALFDPKRPELSGLFGLSLDERRANAYGADPFKDPLEIADLYYDITDNFNEVYKITGVSITDVMRSFKMGGGADKVQFYSALAARLGLVPTALVSGYIPEEYIGISDASDSLMTALELENELISRLPPNKIGNYLDRAKAGKKAERHLRGYVTRVKEKMR